MTGRNINRYAPNHLKKLLIQMYNIVSFSYLLPLPPTPRVAPPLAGVLSPDLAFGL